MSLLLYALLNLAPIPPLWAFRNYVGFSKTEKVLSLTKGQKAGYLISRFFWKQILLKIPAKASLLSFMLLSGLELYQITLIQGSALYVDAVEMDCHLMIPRNSSYEQVWNIVTIPRQENPIWCSTLNPEMILAIQSGFICFGQDVSYGFRWQRVVEHAESSIILEDFKSAFGAYTVLYDLAGLERAKDEALNIQMHALSFQEL